MRDELAIRLERVSKTYRLFASQGEQLMEVLGLNRMRPGTPRKVKEFAALSDINMEIRKGERVGVLGRNGAGKTTMLKLISGNFAPTSGEVEVKGTVQALMNTGLGFHPEATGRENARSSLQYNGLTRAEYEAAMEDILDFCELGDFIDQPFKSYSLGMQARLMFATSTAIRPDILIVDEVLGAGDGYFIVKSRKRMERLVSGGCTMLLVSHSTPQILELCHKAVWLDQGRVRMLGDAFTVVKAYEEFIYGSNAAPTLATGNLERTSTPVLRERVRQVSHPGPGSLLMQEPTFQPHATAPVLRRPPAADAQFDHTAPGGVSRWDSEPGLKVCGLEFITPRGPSSELLALEPLEVSIAIEAELSGHYRCRYGFIMEDALGRQLTRVFSPVDEFDLATGERKVVTLAFNPLQVGSGEYTCGVCIWEYGPLEAINAAKRFDLLNKSFRLRVRVPDSLLATDCVFYHSAEWEFGAPARGRDGTGTKEANGSGAPAQEKQ